MYNVGEALKSHIINVVNVSRDNGRRKYYSKFANAVPAAIIVN